MRRLVALTATSALALLALAPADAAPRRTDRPTPPPWLRVEGGMTQPQFNLDEAVEETLWVQTRVDSDLDGTNDRVRVQVLRPAETESEGIKVPVIFEHSPYRSNFGGGSNHNVDFFRMPQEGIQPRRLAGSSSGRPVSKPDLPGVLDDYWVPRGYAVVLGESIGTGLSDGCATVGGRKETLAAKAVVDWLNGRAAAYDDNGDPVQADWTTGDIGMTGVSYDGTLANQVATTGVEGLRTIVPVSAISNWYDYYRANGLVRAPHSNDSGAGENAFQGEDLDVLADFVNGPSRVAKCRHVVARILARQDRVTGDYNRHWAARNYLRKAKRVEASVFVVHGLEDYNVMPRAFATWWEKLADADVERKIWLHKDGHGPPRDATEYQDTLNRWMAYWLFGVRNGVIREPRADVQSPGGNFEQYADWPVPDSRPARLHLGADRVAEPGTLTPRPRTRGPRPRQSFTDKGRVLNTDSDLLAAPDTAHPNRLAYLSAPLKRPVHLSGTPEISLRASVDNRYAANLTAVVVDYGPVGSAAAPVMVTRGWTDVQNRKRIGRSTPIQLGQKYRFTWELEPDDYVFPAGHRIGLVVVSTDQQYTLRPNPGTRLTVNPSRSSVTLPIVGGRRGLALNR
jgi:X-Pro dipeptidyl-peptidase